MKNIEKWLINRGTRYALKNSKSLAMIVLRDLLEDYNTVLLYGHVLLAGCLFLYRTYRRVSPAVEQRNGCKEESGEETGEGSQEDGIQLDYICELSSSDSQVSVSVVPSGVLSRVETGYLYPDEDEVFNKRKDTRSAFMESVHSESSYVAPVLRKSARVRANLEETVKSVLLFRFLDHDQLVSVVEAMVLVKVEAGEDLIKEGDSGDFFYVVDSGVFEAGRYSASGSWLPVKRYEKGGSFGELALMHSTQRAMTVTCLTGGTVWALDRGTFRRLVMGGARARRSVMRDLISRVAVLERLSDREREQVVDALAPADFAPGTEVVREGDAADGMYFVLSGEARVVQGGRTLARLRGGQYFGEVGLVQRSPRTASVVAETELSTAFLDREAFERLLGPAVDLMKRHMSHYSDDTIHPQR